MSEEIGVADAIERLRAELLSTFNQGPQELQFVVGDIDLELALTVSKAGEGSAGIKWLVVDVGAKAKLSSEPSCFPGTRLSGHCASARRTWPSRSHCNPNRDRATNRSICHSRSSTSAYMLRLRALLFVA
jgi:hypothetical protein